VHALDDVTAVVEDAADVLGVDGAGEVGVAVMFAVTAALIRSSDSLFCVPHVSVCTRVSVLTVRRNLVVPVLREIILQFRLSCQNLVNGLQKPSLAPVGPDGSEQVQGLPEAVGGVVLSDDHVVAAAGCHEDDGPLDPLPALIPLTTYIKHTDTHLSVFDFVHLKPAQQVLQKKKIWVLLLTFEAGLDAVILPQFLGMLEEVLRQRESCERPLQAGGRQNNELVLL
uniref:Uncharacterized protein n=1 Tax=Fundulus heteroclitus TaxID=8078 RepID=A0A3Q2QIM5_FUNHE